MKKKFLLLIVPFLLAVVSPVLANGSGPSATAVGIQNQSATMISAPIVAPDATSTSNANANTSVGVQANPTATGVGIGGAGGTGVGIGGTGIGGSSSSLAIGGDQYMVLDQRNFSKVYNRQFYQASIDQSPNTMQYYGDFEKKQWNVSPIMGATWRVNPNFQKNIPYFRIAKNIWQTREPVSRVTVTGYGNARGDELLAQISVIVTEEQTTADAMEIVKSEAAKIGGNIIEIVAFDAIVVPTSEGWHVGTGAGASGIIGNDEKASVSGAGGTGYGKSSITRETRPFVTARIWAGTGIVSKSKPTGFEKNGAVAPKIDIKKFTEEDM